MEARLQGMTLGIYTWAAVNCVGRDTETSLFTKYLQYVKRKYNVIY